MADYSAWIATAALGLSLLVAIFGYLRKRPLVPAWTVAELRDNHRECIERCEELERRVGVLENQNGMLRSELEWWRDQYRKSKEEHS